MIRQRRRATKNISYREKSDDEFFESISNDDYDKYDDDYAPEISDGWNYDLNRHPDCPTILYMYQVINLQTSQQYLKVGITSIKENKCGTRRRHKVTGNWTVKWDRKNVTQDIIREQMRTRINNQQNSTLYGKSNYVFLHNYKYTKLYPTRTAAKRNEGLIKKFLRGLYGSIPNPPLINRSTGEELTEFFNNPDTLVLEDYQKEEWKRYVNKF